MITVRYPTGHTVCYKEARSYVNGKTQFQLLSDNNSMVAIIPYTSGASIEFYNPSNIKTEFNTLQDALQYVVNNLSEESVSTWGKTFKLLKLLKNKLKRFDARDGRWRLNA